MSRSQQGNVAIITEVVIVIVLVFAFLVAVKTQSKPKEAARDFYPTTSSAADQVAPRPTSRQLPESVAPTPQPKVPQDEIVYTDAGFLPDVLNIQNTNRVIIFRNKSTHALKIASEPHPAHTNLMSINQAKSIEPGGVYWFAFAAGSGVYGYHNELNLGHYGVIIAR